MTIFTSARRAAPDSLLASVLLSFLATAGLFYVNIMPALIEGLMSGLQFSSRQAGLVGSANVYGAAAGALVAAFLVRRWPWRPVAVLLLALLMSIDLLSMAVHTAPLMIAVRLVHGIVGGMLVGFGFSVIARTHRPERTFGMLLLVQFGLGGLCVMLLPSLTALYGTWMLFVTLFAFSAITLLMMRWLADYPRPSTIVETAVSLSPRRVPFALGLVALFLFQAANMALFSFIIDLARRSALDTHFAATAVGVATWIGALGSILVMVTPARLGRLWPLTIGLALTALGMWVLHFSGNATLYVIANCGTSITWAFVVPYLLGVCSAFDTGGQAAALGGFASKVGLATGPLVGALLQQTGSYDLLINLSTAAIVLCALAAAIPARMLDRRAVEEHPQASALPAQT